MIVETVKRHIFDYPRHIRGAQHGYAVREEAKEAMRFFATNSHFSGALLEAYQDMQRKLGVG